MTIIQIFWLLNIYFDILFWYFFNLFFLVFFCIEYFLNLAYWKKKFELEITIFSFLNRCKRFNGLVIDPSVLSVASEKCLRIRAKKWCEPAHRFLRRFVDAGNVEACYILGMVCIFCKFSLSIFIWFCYYVQNIMCGFP